MNPVSVVSFPGNVHALLPVGVRLMLCADIVALFQMFFLQTTCWLWPSALLLSLQRPANTLYKTADSTSIPPPLSFFLFFLSPCAGSPSSDWPRGRASVQGLASVSSILLGWRSLVLLLSPPEEEEEAIKERERVRSRVRESGGRRETAETSDSMQLTENRMHEEGKTHLCCFCSSASF